MGIFFKKFLTIWKETSAGKTSLKQRSENSWIVLTRVKLATCNKTLKTFDAKFEKLVRGKRNLQRHFSNNGEGSCIG